MDEMEDWIDEKYVDEDVRKRLGKYVESGETPAPSGGDDSRRDNGGGAATAFCPSGSASQVIFSMSIAKPLNVLLRNLSLLNKTVLYSISKFPSVVLSVTLDIKEVFFIKFRTVSGDYLDPAFTLQGLPTTNPASISPGRVEEVAPTHPWLGKGPHF